MTPLEVIVIGISVVFITLGILTLSTYFFGWIINKFFIEKEEDEEEKIAAIAAAIQSRGRY
ncbi:MAG: OadG family transporter subunit [Candidatus Aenigmatarchaeota archaeon]